MGSLMAGWSSEHMTKTGLAHAGSFTKTEIEAFWRLRKEEVEEHAAHLAEYMQPLKEDAPLPPNPFDADDPEDLTDEEKRLRMKDWWRTSNLAYLNAPPEKGYNETRGGTYVTQHEVALGLQAT